MEVGNRKYRIAVGLSGGVDSSVVASMLKRQGHDVIGIHMVTYDVDQPGCSGSKDRADALIVAKQLGIPFRVVDFRKNYKEKVIDRFVAEFKNGRTPNPDIWCNEEIKFGLFLDYAISKLKVDKIATGHYARIREVPTKAVHQPSKYELLAGIDPKKDQSYFLYRLTRYQLSKSIFPLGEYTKEQVRDLANDFGLSTAHKPDSVGICFIGDIDVKEFLRDRIVSGPGDVVDVDGNVVGKHVGVPFYTIGQRHGFELTTYQAEPLYVIEKDVEKNQLVVGKGRDSDVTGFSLSDYYSLVSKSRAHEFQIDELAVRIRHLGELVPCKLRFESEMDNCICELGYSLRGVSPGQHAVLYHKDVIVGGGVIDKTISRVYNRLAD